MRKCKLSKAFVFTAGRWLGLRLVVKNKHKFVRVCLFCFCLPLVFFFCACIFLFFSPLSSPDQSCSPHIRLYSAITQVLSILHSALLYLTDLFPPLDPCFSLIPQNVLLPLPNPYFVFNKSFEFYSRVLVMSSTCVQNSYSSYKIVITQK